MVGEQNYKRYTTIYSLTLFLTLTPILWFPKPPLISTQTWLQINLNIVSVLGALEKNSSSDRGGCKLQRSRTDRFAQFVYKLVD